MPVPLRSALIALTLVVVACSPAPAEVTRESTATMAPGPAAPPPTEGELRARISGIGEEPAAEESEPPGDVVLVGDSVMVLVTDDVALRTTAELHVDAADCRRIDMDVFGPCGGVPSGSVVRNGIDAIAETIGDLADEGVRPGAAVVVLANNSSVTADQLDQAMAAMPTVDRVWWVTTRIEGFGRQDPNNRAIEDLAGRDDRAGVIDWFAASEGKDWLADNVHPNDAGQRALGRLIARHLACDCTP